MEHFNLSRVAQARLGRERPLRVGGTHSFRGTEVEKAPGTGNDLV